MSFATKILTLSVGFDIIIRLKQKGVIMKRRTHDTGMSEAQ